MLKILRTHRGNVARAHSDQQAALMRVLVDELHERRAVGSIEYRLSRMTLSDQVCEHLGGSAGDGHLARREYVNQDNGIGIGEGIGKIAGKRL